MITNFHKFKNKIYAHDGKQIISQDGVEIPSLDNAPHCSFATISNQLMIAPGNNNNVWWHDGTVHRETTATTSKNFLLKANCLCNHRGILYVANLVESDGEHKARIRWSAFGEPENLTPFGINNYQNFQDIGDTEDPILALVSYRNDLYICKRDSIWMASGVASDFVGPEIIREISGKFGIVSPNSVMVYERGLRLITQGGIYQTVNGIELQRIYEEIWPQLEWRKRELWGNVSIDSDPVSGFLFILLPRYKTENEDCLVRSRNGQWANWKWGRNINTVKILPDSTGKYETFFGDYWDGVYKIDPNKRTDFETNEFIDPVWDSGWVDLSQRTNLIRSLQLLLRQEGEFSLKVEIFADMQLNAILTETIQMTANNTVADIVTNDGVMDRAQTDIDQTALYNEYIHHLIDVNFGHCQKLKVRLSALGKNNRFRLSEAKLGMIPKGGI